MDKNHRQAKVYYLDGLVSDRIYHDRKLHRVDGPAVEWGDGRNEWYQNGLLHRLGGPAIEGAGGHKAWYQNGKCHRLDGPAIEFSNGKKHWLINGKHLSKEEFEKHILIMRLSGLLDG